MREPNPATLSARMDRPVLRIPFESLSREFRNAQKLVEREIVCSLKEVSALNEELRARGGAGGAGGGEGGHGGSTGGAGGNSSGNGATLSGETKLDPAVKARLRDTADRLHSLKRKLLGRVEAEKTYLERCAKRVRHLYECRAAGLCFDSDRTSAGALNHAVQPVPSSGHIALEAPETLHRTRSSSAARGGEASRDNLRVAGSRPAIDEALSARSSLDSSAATARARLRREFM